MGTILRKGKLAETIPREVWTGEEIREILAGAPLYYRIAAQAGTGVYWMVIPRSAFEDGAKISGELHPASVPVISALLVCTVLLVPPWERIEQMAYDDIIRLEPAARSKDRARSRPRRTWHPK